MRIALDENRTGYDPSCNVVAGMSKQGGNAALFFRLPDPEGTRNQWPSEEEGLPSALRGFKAALTTYVERIVGLAESWGAASPRRNCLKSHPPELSSGMRNSRASPARTFSEIH